MRIFLLFSVLFCQTHRVSFNLSQANVQKHPYVNFQNTTTFKENRILFSNYNKNHSSSNWFYSMGPYNDTWGSDILKVNNAEGKRPINYYPFGNSILSFQSQHQNRYFNKCNCFEGEKMHSFPFLFLILNNSTLQDDYHKAKKRKTLSEAQLDVRHLK